MADFQRKNNTVSLFKNDKKKSETDRDYQGAGLIDNVEYWASGWINKKKDSGEKWLKLSFDPKEALPETTEIDADETPTTLG